MFTDDKISFSYTLNRIIKKVKKDYGLKEGTADFIKSKVKEYIREDVEYLLNSTLFDGFFKAQYKI